MPLRYVKDGKVATFTLDRPDALNVIDPDTLREYADALVDFRKDDRLRVGIVTGSGSKAFCAGADIKTMLPWLKENIGSPWLHPPTTMRGLELWKPMIAAVNGVALGGGLEIALSCDLRIASENAMFGVPEVKLGLIPGWGGNSRLAHLLPWAVAAEMLFTGKPINAQEAYRVGLVNRVVPQAELMAAARASAESICENGPLAVMAAKKILLASKHFGLEEGLRLELQAAERLLNSQDFKEGVNAFVNKTRPLFKGN